MTAFVTIAVLLLISAGLFVLAPLLARAGEAGARDGAPAVSARVLREQLSELDAELARGAITDAQYAGARAEIERRVLDDAASPAATAPAAEGLRRATPSPARSIALERRIALALACVVPAAAGGLYALLGSPGALDPAAAPEPAAHALTQAQVRERVERLADRLRERPDDVDGWQTLARSQAALRDFKGAADSYRRALSMKPRDAQLLADYADILAMLAGRRLAGEPESVVMQALALDASHPKALALAGTASFERGDFPAALRYWERLLAVLPPGADAARSIQGSVADARRRLAGQPSANASVAAAPAATAGPGVRGTVSLAPSLAAQARPDDVVFVVARAVEGPRTPLAVLRKRARDLPFDFLLDDSMAMDASRPLSGAGRIVVAARVSRTGQAAPQPGDLDGASAPVTPGAHGVTVRIDRAIP